MKHRRWLRWGLALGLTIVAMLAGAWAYVAGIDLSHGRGDPTAQQNDLAWLAAASPPARGRILAVVSSVARTPDGRARAGYELTELARAYWVFQAAGFEVDIASPAGGEAPKVMDEDLVDADYAFLNDPVSRAKISHTLRLEALDPADYAAVYIVGGKGAMFDLHENPILSKLLEQVYRAGGVVAAVCHGPAALLRVQIDGRPLLAGRRVTGFSNAEELFLMEDAVQRLGFLLQDALSEQAEFVEAPMYLENVVVDGRVLTAQNPWSTWALAEAVVRTLGAAPAPRPRTPEEHSVDLLALFEAHGLATARMRKTQSGPHDNGLILMHALIAGMRGEPGRALALARLARA